VTIDGPVLFIVLEVRRATARKVSRLFPPPRLDEILPGPAPPAVSGKGARVLQEDHRYCSANVSLLKHC